MDLDDSVLDRLRAGDGAALEVCYRVFGARVQRLCRRLVGRDHGDDVAQDVFVQVLEHAAQFRGRSRFSTWLFRIAVNQCARRGERERLRRADALPERGPDACWTDPGPGAVDDREELERWLALLAPDQRAVLVLRELEGLEYAEIAEVLGVPAGTVMSRLHRARTKLIECGRATRPTGLGTVHT